MSSRKAAPKKSRRGAAPSRARPKAAAARRPPAAGKAKAAAAGAALSAGALALGAEIEKALAADRLGDLSPEAIQALMASLCRFYAAKVEAGESFTPVAEGQVVSPTGIMMTASGLLKAANLAVFELGMWHSWTGR